MTDRAFTIRVREVVEYDIEIRAPNANSARLAALDPPEQRPETQLVSREVAGLYMHGNR